MCPGSFVMPSCFCVGHEYVFTVNCWIVLVHQGITTTPAPSAVHLVASISVPSVGHTI